MTPEERRRAGQAVRDRMVELDMNATEVQLAAGIDNKTLGSVLDGTRRPNTKTLGKIERALQWKPGEIERRGRMQPGTDPIEAASETRLLAELLRRAALREASTPAVESQEDDEPRTELHAADNRPEIDLKGPKRGRS